VRTISHTSRPELDVGKLAARPARSGRPRILEGRGARPDRRQDRVGRSEECETGCEPARGGGAVGGNITRRAALYVEKGAL
jgi:hypothetical protein